MAAQPPPISTPDLAALVAAGTDALNDGDLRVALDRFEEVVNAFPDRPEGHNNLGALHMGLGDYEKAEACFDRVLELLVGHPNVHYNRGLARSRQGKFTAARADFSVTLKADPDDPDTLNNLGVAAYMEGALSEARERFEVAMKLRPGYANALLNLVDVECAAGRPDRAADLCRDFLASHDDAEVRRRLVDLLATGARDMMAEAVVTAESILVAGPDPAVEAELGRLRRAQSAWQMAAAAAAD